MPIDVRLVLEFLQHCSSLEDLLWEYVPQADVPSAAPLSGHVFEHLVKLQLIGAQPCAELREAGIPRLRELTLKCSTERESFFLSTMSYPSLHRIDSWHGLSLPSEEVRRFAVQNGSVENLVLRTDWWNLSALLDRLREPLCCDPALSGVDPEENLSCPWPNLKTLECQIGRHQPTEAVIELAQCLTAIGDLLRNNDQLQVRLVAVLPQGHNVREALAKLAVRYPSRFVHLERK